LIAFEESLQHEVYLLHHGKGIIGGGMFGVRLSGHGAVCFSARGGLLRLQVTDQAPLFTDPNSTLAWSEGVSPAFKTDLGWRSLFKHGGGEPIQMLFQGNGLVAVEPGEEPYPVSGHLIKKIAKAFGL
jgi:uncharacterized protein (AIM24 family)